MRFPFALSILLAGCAPTVYTPVEPVTFPATAPRPVVFDALAREAVSLGYVMEYVDPMNGVFHVHSRMMGRRPSRRPRRGVARGVIRSNLFIVEVGEGGVRISAIGRHVEPDGDMHPTLAEELHQFGQRMQARAQALGATFVPIPQPPSSYGVQPQAPMPPQPQPIPPPQGAPPGSGAPSQDLASP